MEEGWRIVTIFVISCIMLRPKEVSRRQSDKQGRELWSACRDLEAARSLEHSRKSRKMFKAEEGHDQNLVCVCVCVCVCVVVVAQH